MYKAVRRHLHCRIFMGDALGKGAFGVVYKGLNIESGEVVAIKRVELQGIPEKELAALESELNLLQKLNHTNIVQYVGCIRSDKHLNIVLEYMENGSLFNILKKFGTFPETLTSVYIVQVLQGLEYLHKEGVIHRDIKAGNVLTTKEGTVKLADFGIATLDKASRKSGEAEAEIIGSPYWMAPEIITMDGAQPSSDIWSVGCTIIELMTGKPPYFDMPQMSAMFKIAEEEDPPPFPTGISDDMKDFLLKCFERDPAKRPSAAALLEHPWVKGRARKGSRIKDQEPEKPKKRKAKRKDSEKPKEKDDRSGSLTHRNILRTNSSNSLSLISALEDVNKMEDELEELRQQVIIEVRNNQSLEQDVKRLDKKIELLIKNRITLEEVLKDPKAAGKFESPEPSMRGSAEKERGKRLDSRLVEGYSRVFYLLQTEPKYLANFIFFLPQLNNMDKFIEMIILTMYGYAYSPREEFLLLQFLSSAIHREIGNLSSLHAFTDEAQVLIKMILAYNSRVQEQDFLRSLLGKPLDAFFELKDLNLEYDAKKVYRQLITAQEMKTGEAVKLSPDASDAEIFENVQVKNIVNERVKKLLELSNLFVDAILVSLPKFPYGLRWICRDIKQALHEKFKDASDSDVALVIGYIIYYRFINPALVSPDDFAMADGQVTMAQRVNLISISKILSGVSNNKTIEGDGPGIATINKYIKAQGAKMAKFFSGVTDDVPDPSSHLRIDRKYLEYTQTQKPQIYISPNEMFFIHRFIKERLDKIAKDPEDPLRALISSLPDPPPTDDNDSFLSSEISLTLIHMSSVSAQLDKSDKPALADLATEKLYNKTKKMICEIMAESAMESLLQLDLLELLTGQEVTGNSKLAVTVGKILENLEQLEEKGKVSKSNHYKVVLEDIQQDIRQKTVMRDKIAKELQQMKLTMDRLCDKKSYLNEQLNAYNEYVKACLEQAVRATKSDKKKKSGSIKKGSAKYTCGQLVKKGVITEIEGVSTKQYETVTFNLMETDAAGVFETKVYFAGIPVESLNLHLDDLLEKQENGVYIYELLDGKCKLRINLLIHILNAIAIK